MPHRRRANAMPRVNRAIYRRYDGSGTTTTFKKPKGVNRAVPQFLASYIRYSRQGGLYMGTILLIILILILVGALPTWPYSSGWGYYPSGGIGLVLLILIILLVMGRI